MAFRFVSLERMTLTGASALPCIVQKTTYIINQWVYFLLKFTS